MNSIHLCTIGAILIACAFVAPSLGGACYGITDGFVYSTKQNDLTHKTVGNLGECCDYCQATSQCKAFSYRKASRECFLKSATTSAGRVPNPDAIYGFPEDQNPSTSQGSGACYGITDGFGYSIKQNDLTYKTVGNVGECCDYCRATTKCKAFSYRKASRECYLKSATTSAQPVPNPDAIYGFPEDQNPTPVYVPPQTTSSYYY